MRRAVKYISEFIFALIILLLFIYIIGMKFFPERMKSLVGYQTFVVLTDSMEPTIPVGSLVVVKNITKGQEIQENTIISFYVNRFGNNAVFTHYFRKKEIDETGRERYYTQAENADRYDGYKTYEEDLLGTYVLHVPYVGRFIQFLQSPFALLELGIILIIMIIYHILVNKFDEEEKVKLALQEEQEDIIESSAEESAMVSMTKPESEQLSDSAEATETKIPAVEAVLEVEAALPDKESHTKGGELPAEQESPEPARNVFSYCMNRPDSRGGQSSEGFSIEIFRDGTIWHRINSADGQEPEILTYSIGKKAAKKIRKLIKDNASVIRKLPKSIDNNAREGNYSTFSFMGQEIDGRNLQAHDLKKEKRRNLYYYKKYKQSMKYENEVMYLFKQIGKILKEEGIKLKPDKVRKL